MLGFEGIDAPQIKESVAVIRALDHRRTVPQPAADQIIFFYQFAQWSFGRIILAGWCEVGTPRGVLDRRARRAVNEIVEALLQP